MNDDLPTANLSPPPVIVASAALRIEPCPACGKPVDTIRRRADDRNRCTGHRLEPCGHVVDGWAAKDHVLTPGQVLRHEPPGRGQRPPETLSRAARRGNLTHGRRRRR